MYICRYIHKCIYTYIYADIQIYIYNYNYIYVCRYTCIYADIQIYNDTYTYRGRDRPILYLSSPTISMDLNIGAEYVYAV